ncbi:hypothetical protein [Persephonella sp. KM09-Lau-8]|uniref:hypothetical protein n=1 Tax=Persephonella sp. KM09-Lau-8 TaxID=1158345 RepID=UPI0004955474|nr:hypothetical protein [Persephonella sp. KM09-Lau-8]
MRRGLIMLLLGAAVGAAGAYAATQRREELLEKLNDIQNSLKDAELKGRAKAIVSDVSEKIKTLLKKGEELTPEEREEVLEEVEEKIKKLEEVVKG